MRKYLFPIVLLFLVSCAGIKVTNQWDKTVDFSEFKTFSMYPWDTYQDKSINDYDKQTIINAIEVEMKKRGYKQVDKDGELVVSAFVVVKQETSYTAYTDHYGGWAGYGGGWGYGMGAGYYGYGYGGYGVGYSTTTVTQTDYRTGTLIIDIFRLSDKKLLWQGIGSGEVTEDLARRDRVLPTRITEIYRRYPVHPMSQKKLDKMNNGS